MPRSQFLALVLLCLGCEDASDHVVVPLAGPTELSATPVTLTPATPLSATDDENGICLLPPAGYDLHTEWTLGLPGEPGVGIRGAALLTNGDTVALNARSWSGELCLGREGHGPWPAPAREVRVWSSGPITVQGITWVSTHK